MSQFPKIPKLLKITMRLVLVLLVVEVILRLIGFSLNHPSDVRNALGPEDSGKLRILAIGESTTADYFADEPNAAWPRQLEIALRKKGVDARVFNEGIGGTTSAMILSRVSNYLDEYQPQIVISMMGVNDVYDLRYDGSKISQVKLVLTQIRLVKIVNWLIQSIESQTQCKIEYHYLAPENLKLVDQVMELSKNHNLDEIEKKLKITDPETLALVLAYAVEKMKGDLDSNQAPPDLISVYADRAFDLYPMNYRVAFEELQSFERASPSSRALEVSKKLMECGSNLSDDLLSMMSRYLAEDSSVVNNALFRSRGLVFDHQQDSATASHYRALYQILKQRGIQYVAMQYPTLSVGKLQSYFVDANLRKNLDLSNIIFASNEENFRVALTQHKYEELFRDRFRGSWGHTTGLGHQLVAESALAAIEKLDLKNFKRTR